MSEIRHGRVGVPEGDVNLSTAFVTANMGGNPIGRTFVFEFTQSGTVYHYAGVPCVVNGDQTTFKLDEAMLLSTRPATEEEDGSPY